MRNRDTLSDNDVSTYIYIHICKMSISINYREKMYNIDDEKTRDHGCVTNK